jgi:hypothetical protein
MTHSEEMVPLNTFSDDAGELGDEDIILKMLHFCEEPRTTAQIMSYCRMDKKSVRRFSEHCMRRSMLKLSFIDYGREALITTARGKEVLVTARKVMKVLGIDSEQAPVLK